MSVATGCSGEHEVGVGRSLWSTPTCFDGDHGRGTGSHFLEGVVFRVHSKRNNVGYTRVIGAFDASCFSVVAGRVPVAVLCCPWPGARRVGSLEEGRCR